MSSKKGNSSSLRATADNGGVARYLPFCAGFLLIAGLLALAFGLAFSGSSPSPPEICKTGFATCPGDAVECSTDIFNDNLNCGGCEFQCPFGSFCNGGLCECELPLVGCDSRCVDLQTDLANCGACNSICSINGASCNNGSCECPANLEICMFACTNTSSSTSHCGGCNKACPIGAVCDNGECICPQGTTYCEITGCVNFENSTENCGGCGEACPVGVACVNSVCACPVNEKVCGNNCTNVQTDSFNCGICDNNCRGQTDSTGVCDNGSCVPCPASTQNCDGQLGVCNTPILNDPNNCGGCNSSCINVTSTGVCDNGFCEKCPEGKANCALGTGFCNTNLLTSEQNCGACGRVCENGNACINGTCECVSNCNCTGDATRCGDVCVDINTDVFNCGSCGAACVGENQVCQNGVCACPAPSILCGNVCVNPNDDANNCGTCNNACVDAPNYGKNFCDNGECVPCNFPFKSCDSSQSICAQNILTDVFNCGACNNVCLLTQNVLETECIGGSCKILECFGGFADCNGIYEDGCESDLDCECCNLDTFACFFAFSPGQQCSGIDELCKSNNCVGGDFSSCQPGAAGTCCTVPDDCLSNVCDIPRRQCL
jgi:hypothetical protein